MHHTHYHQKTNNYHFDQQKQNEQTTTKNIFNSITILLNLVPFYIIVIHYSIDGEDLNGEKGEREWWKVCFFPLKFFTTWFSTLP